MVEDRNLKTNVLGSKFKALKVTEMNEKIRGLREVLDNCIKNEEDKTHITVLADLMESGELSEIFLAIFKETDTAAMKIIISDLIKLPDRLSNMAAANKSNMAAANKSNMAAANKSSLPSAFKPNQFCSYLLKNLAAALSNCFDDLNGQLPAFLLSKLFLNYNVAVNSAIGIFWRFCVAKLKEEQAAKQESIFSSLMSFLDNSVLEKCFLSGLKHIRSGDDLFLLFGTVFKESRKFSILENNIFMRGLLGEDEMLILFSYIKLLDKALLIKIANKAFLLFSDAAYVEHGDYSAQLNLCQCLCVCLSVLTELQIMQAKTSSLPILMKGTVHWFDSTIQKRNLGMNMVLIILSRFGEDKLPEWEIKDQELFDNLQMLASKHKKQKDATTESSDTILSAWTFDSPPSVQPLKTELSKPVPQKSELEDPHKSLRDEPAILDSDDDEEDDLVAFDLSGDTTKAENEKKIFYLREAVDEIADPESDYAEHCLGLIPDLCRRHLKHEDPAIVQHMVKVILFSQNRFDTPEWIKLRERSMISILETRPIEAARCLVPAFYDKNYSMDTRFGMLSWLTQASSSISKIYSGKVEFSEYIKITVQGLCGGAGWSKLEFTGLDTHIVSQLLLSTGSILKEGKNILGWEHLAADYLELVLYTASSGRSVIQTACVHSISLVLALTKAHMVDNMGDVLGRVGYWLAERQGELKEGGSTALILLSALQQEATKLQVQQQLRPANISTTTPQLRPTL